MSHLSPNEDETRPGLPNPYPGWQRRLDGVLLWLTRHWLGMLTGLLAVYVGLPFAAPTLMHLGAEGPAQAVYSLYTPLCHRFAFRSFFLYGEQGAYPLASTGTDLVPYEAYIGRSVIPDAMGAGQVPQPPFNVEGLPEFTGVPVQADFDLNDPAQAYEFARLQIASAGFVGNETMGYKMALCERDIAIYAALLGVALIYRVPVVRRKLRPAPLWLWLLLGVVPIGLDGVSQLLGYPPFNLWPPRETLPVFRVVTGALFGGMIGWLAYPHINVSMWLSARDIQRKRARLGFGDAPAPYTPTPRADAPDSADR